MSPPPLFLVSFVSLFLAFPALLFAAAIPVVAPELQEHSDGRGGGQQSAAQGLAAPFVSAGNQTDSQTGVYFCTAVFWNANVDPNGDSDADAACFYDVVSSPSSSSSATGDDANAIAVSDPCVRLRGSTAAAQGKPHVSAYRNVGSFAPDDGVECVVYDADDCTGASLRIAAPGFTDLGVVGWARRIASYACVASSAASTSSGGSWFGTGEQ